ncbi:hypothetical protein DPMN_046944 [Dreissena polymorpha]|uniref:Uncharacterized protein n=1 Tax=Dreissena polymorpha TaxID=45954 RepID=A0A9D4I127_DREPO|nr:hypothetical protein DPMN_046944 [Dreissena polymorpha]
MSEVLDNSRAGKRTVMERRKSYLSRERMERIRGQLYGLNLEYFHFGCQSEGTTIPGLKSDIDFLFSSNNENIMIVWEDWEAGMRNFLMLHDDITPPQQFLLQVIKEDTPEPVRSLCNDANVMKYSGEVLLSAERFKQENAHYATEFGEATKNGPSVSFIYNWDMVHAFHVLKPLPEIQYWIDRCKSRQWPPAKLLAAARVAPCFLVPAGHRDRDYKREEWRLSHNLIERMLMFSFNMTQI